MIDVQTIGGGVVVGASGWQDALEANTRSFADEWTARQDFQANFPSAMSSADYVDKLFANAGVAPTTDERAAIIADLYAGRATRAAALRKVAENPALARQEFARAFVLMQYFGYLRRNPDDAPDANFDGYNFWLNKLNAAGGDFQKAEMVRSFILSNEYRHRFDW